LQIHPRARKLAVHTAKKSALMNLIAPLAIAATLAAHSASPPPADYLTWQSQRVQSLTAEKGWLTLIGLHWLEPGSYTIGSGADQQIRLAAGPAQMGKINYSDGKIVFQAQGDVLIDGKAAATEVSLSTDKEGAAPTEVSMGSVSFFAIDRSGKIGLRVKDSQASTRTVFLGLDYFAYQPKLNITARYEAYKTPRTIEVATIIGTVEPTPNPGRAHFSYAGKNYSFELLEGSDATHFFTVFGDQTNGKETYGMARFLAGAIDITAGTVTLDFNRAYNPPCAFTEYATCPMPPAGNRIAAKVLAGEKAYRGGHKE
jgi:uncharacterized protein